MGQDGLTASDLQPDDTILQYFIDFNEECSTYRNEELQTSQTLTDLARSFKQACVGKEKCNVDFDYRGLDPTCLKEVLRRSFASEHDALVNKILDQRDTDRDRKMIDWYLDLPEIAAQTDADAGQFSFGPDAAVPEPLLYLVAQCDNQLLKIKYFDVEVTKSELNLFLVLSDIILTTLLIVGFNLISLMQKDLCREYDAQSVEARDFTLVIDKLPASFKQYNDELSLKHAIWQQI